MLQAINKPLPVGGRLLRFGCVLLGLMLSLAYITVPMAAEQQSFLTIAGIFAFLIIRRSPSRKATLVLVFLSLLATARYLFWRAADTLSFDGFAQGLLSIGLLAAETYAGILLVLSYLQTAYPLNRKPVPLPHDPNTWPTIDVFIATYNEALEIVRPTVLAALNLDWPRDKINIYILDDGRREDFRRFAEASGCGYIIRPDNNGAKAGNINHALRHTDGEFIAIFDCDHAPTRAFLQMTVGWLVRDATLAMVQTPHHFYSPDPFERNLARDARVPNEGLLFYGVIQQGNDLWNAAFFCGSCAVLRREALEEVGGVPHVTVTEDCHCSFLMQQRGWGTAYLRVPLAAGLATERLALHVGQRLRWARGMIQIMRLERTPIARGLSLLQRTCYFASSFSFLFALPRLVFLTAPLAFLFFGQNIIAASPLAIIAYAGSHMFHTFGTTSRVNGSNRHSFWSEVYETVMALSLLPLTILTLWDPTKGKFNVTDKGGTVEHGYLDLRVVWPNIVLLCLLLTGFSIGVWGISTTDGLVFQAYLLNTIWCGLCLVPVSASVAVGREREQARARARVETDIEVELVVSGESRVRARSSDLSLSGARLTLERPLNVADGDQVAISFATCGEVIVVPATLVRWQDDQAFVLFNAASLVEEAAIARVFFGRPNAWLHWDHWPKDRPLQSLAILVRATIGAVFRKYRFKVSKPSPARQPVAVPQAARVSDVIRPRFSQVQAAERVKTAATILACVLLTSPALAQGPVQVVPPSAAPPLPTITVPASPATLAAPTSGNEGTREVKLTLRDLGLRSPMQMHGVSDLRGVLFGMRSDELVTSATLRVTGAVSPALLPSLSQIAVTLNDQAVGTVGIDPARPNLGPVEIPLDPLFFMESNRLNFRFTGRYTTECNDPLSGLLWANISDLSTLTMRIARLPQTRDLSRLPEPFFDRRVTQDKLVLPFVVPESTGPAGLRAAAVAASWFAVLADYRGASFPVSRTVPSSGNAVLLSVNGETQGLVMPRMDGPGLAVVPNPSDPLGTILVIGGRSEADVATAATALAASHNGFSGEQTLVQAPQLAPRAPYVAPRWLPPDRPVLIGDLVDRSELQASGYTPATIRVPLRTAPDLYTWRNGGFPVEVQYRAPPGPIVDVAVSRLDVSLSESYLRSLPLAQDHSRIFEWVERQLGLHSDTMTGRVALPPYLMLGRDELRLRFDMRPLARGECVAIPESIQASIDPNSTVDISRAWRYARMPNLGFFASSGFPFTRFADLSGTAAVLPEHPSTVETGAFLDLTGFLSSITGASATGLQVVSAASLQSAANRDLLVVGALGRSPALNSLFRDGPLQVSNSRLTLSLPDAFQNIRALFTNAPDSNERTRASLALDGAGEGLGVIVGRESNLAAGRSVVAVTGMTPSAVAAVVAAVQDSQGGALVQGDLTLVQSGQTSSFRTASGYDVGSLPPWLWPQHWLGDRPERAALVLLAAACLLGLPLFWMLRRRSAMRLRARTSRL